LHQLPQIVASFDKEALDEVKKLFALLTYQIIVLDPLEAELLKLFLKKFTSHP
jgi:UDP-N-acetyl-D-mannosaminuronic acid dehydrogenase